MDPSTLRNTSFYPTCVIVGMSFNSAAVRALKNRPGPKQQLEVMNAPPPSFTKRTSMKEDARETLQRTSVSLSYSNSVSENSNSQTSMPTKVNQSLSQGE